MNNQEEIWGVIVNPYAGTRQLRKDWIDIYHIMKRANIHFRHQATAYPTHATEIARNMVENGLRHILVVGGDGTLNEVVNGIYTSNIEDKSSVTLALIPYGTGNDWGRYWGLKRKDKNIAQRILARKKQLVDIGRVTIQEDDKTTVQYFLNGFGLGFDGAVVKVTNNLKRFCGGSSRTYHLAVILTLFGYSSRKMTLSTEDQSITRSFYTLSIGNGCYSGGGLKQTPLADPTDGVFHITSIERPNLWKILIGLRQLFNGQLDQHPLAHTFVTNHFEIESVKNVIAETDGVLLPLSKKYSIDTLPGSLYMLV